MRQSSQEVFRMYQLKQTIPFLVKDHSLCTINVLREERHSIVSDSVVLERCMIIRRRMGPRGCGCCGHRSYVAGLFCACGTCMFFSSRVYNVFFVNIPIVPLRTTGYKQRLTTVVRSLSLQRDTPGAIHMER